MSVGERIGRADGRDKVLGKARYVDDLPFEGLYGRTIRSTIPHGKVRAIEFDQNFDWSDVVRVDYRDIPAKNLVALIKDDQPCLVEEEIQHAEEAILLLACADREKLARAVRAVRVIEEPSPAVLSLEEGITKQMFLGSLDISRGDVEEGFSKAHVIVEGEYRVGHQEQLYIEPQGVIATPREDGGIKIEGSMQCPYYVSRALSELFGLPEEKIQVIATVVGGGFGGKEDYPSMISCHAALLAKKSGRPVKMIYDRGEDIRATTKRHPALIRHRWGVSKEGDILAAEMELYIDGGAYVTLSPVVLSRGLIHGLGPYRHAAARLTGKIVKTHTPPNGAFRGFGAPQAIFAAERQLDRVARTLGIHPVALRQRLALREGDRTVTGQRLGESVGAIPVLEKGVEKYHARKAAAEAFNREAERTQSPLRRGVGLSFFYHGNGFTGNGEAKIQGKVDAEALPDGRVRIYSASTDIGQGTLTIFRQIAAGALSLPIEKIDVAQPDTSQVPNSGPTVASRTCMVVGKVVEDASRALCQGLKEFLASRTGADAAQILYQEGSFQTPEGARMSWQEAAAQYAEVSGKPLRVQSQYQAPPGIVWDEERYQGDAYPVYSFASDVVEVEVDLDTAETRVLSLYTAHDIGRPIHPVLAEGQIEGGSLQGLGYATVEEVRFKDGRVFNDRLTTYIIPTALDAPEMEVDLVVLPYSGGPFGAKGVGEIPMDGPAPAVAQAIGDAVGVESDEIPVTPERLLSLLESRFS